MVLSVSAEGSVKELARKESDAPTMAPGFGQCRAAIISEEMPAEMNLAGER